MSLDQTLGTDKDPVAGELDERHPSVVDPQLDRLPVFLEALSGFRQRQVLCRAITLAAAVLWHNLSPQ
jgi:hypothetical protein